MTKDGRLCDHCKFPLDRPQPIIHAPGSRMCKLLSDVAKAARGKDTVLILGETGTGKELIAHAIHDLSPRSSQVFATCSAANLNSELLESELFGHVKGAFTGAVTNKVGLVESADGGLLFLDEIGEMAVEIQAKILRLLENKEYSPVGSTMTRRADVRIVAATNADLQRKIHERAFREDLFHRLNVLPILVPPLRKRASDIPIIAKYFLEEWHNTNHKPVPKFDASAITWLRTYSWPGNVRELRNAIARMMTLAPPEDNVVRVYNFVDSLDDFVATPEQVGRWLVHNGVQHRLARLELPPYLVIAALKYRPAELELVVVDDYWPNHKAWRTASQWLAEELERASSADSLEREDLSLTVGRYNESYRIKWHIRVVSPGDLLVDSEKLRAQLARCGLLVLDLDFGDVGGEPWVSGYHLWAAAIRACPWLRGMGSVFFSIHGGDRMALERFAVEARRRLQGDPIAEFLGTPWEPGLVRFKLKRPIPLLEANADEWEGIRSQLVTQLRGIYDRWQNWLKLVPDEPQEVPDDLEFDGSGRRLIGFFRPGSGEVREDSGPGLGAEMTSEKSSVLDSTSKLANELVKQMSAGWEQTRARLVDVKVVRDDAARACVELFEEGRLAKRLIEASMLAATFGYIVERVKGLGIEVREGQGTLSNRGRYEKSFSARVLKWVSLRSGGAQ